MADLTAQTAGLGGSRGRTDHLVAAVSATPSNVTEVISTVEVAPTTTTFQARTQDVVSSDVAACRCIALSFEGSVGQISLALPPRRFFCHNIIQRCDISLIGYLRKISEEKVDHVHCLKSREKSRTLQQLLAIEREVQRNLIDRFSDPFIHNSKEVVVSEVSQ